MRDIEKQLLGHAEIGDLDGPNGVISVLKTGVNVDIQDEHGRTALMWAAMNGHMGVVNSLLQAGTNVNIQDRYGKTALIRATYWGHTEIVERLVQAGTNINISDEDGRTALDIAKIYNHIQIIILIGQRKKAKPERYIEDIKPHDMLTWF